METVNKDEFCESICEHCDTKEGELRENPYVKAKCDITVMQIICDDCFIDLLNAI